MATLGFKIFGPPRIDPECYEWGDEISKFEEGAKEKKINLGEIVRKKAK